MIEYLMVNWLLLMVIIFILTSSTCVCHHVTRKDRLLVAERIPEHFDPVRQQRMRLGLEPVIVARHYYNSVFK